MTFSHLGSCPRNTRTSPDRIYVSNGKTFGILLWLLDHRISWIPFGGDQRQGGFCHKRWTYPRRMFRLDIDIKIEVSLHESFSRLNMLHLNVTWLQVSKKHFCSIWSRGPSLVRVTKMVPEQLCPTYWRDAVESPSNWGLSLELTLISCFDCSSTYFW